MRPIRQALTSISVGVPIVLDHYQQPSFVALSVKITGGAATATYKVEHTFDDVFASGFDPATAVWHTHPQFNNLTADADGNYQEVPIACRLNVSALGAGATCTLTVIQQGAGL